MNNNESVLSYCLKLGATVIAVALLMTVTAQNPSADDAVRGSVGGLIGGMLSLFMQRK